MSFSPCQAGNVQFQYANSAKSTKYWTLIVYTCTDSHPAINSGEDFQYANWYQLRLPWRLPPNCAGEGSRSNYGFVLYGYCGIFICHGPGTKQSSQRLIERWTSNFGKRIPERFEVGLGGLGEMDADCFRLPEWPEKLITSA